MPAYPIIDIDTEKISALMRLKPTLADTAAFFKCAERTIERFIRDNFNLTFVEFRDQNMVHTRLDLVREAIRQAKSGNTAMLIFCLKNVCQWADKVDVGTSDNMVFNLKYNIDKKHKNKDVIDVKANEIESGQTPGVEGDSGAEEKKS